MIQTILITAPVSSRSGYGDHARDLIESLIYQDDKYELFINDVRWGDCPRNALSENTELNNLIKERSFQFGGMNLKLNNKPNVYIDIRIPNEFEQLGDYNIGITAGIETNAVSPAFIEGCNKMDLVITTSNHSKFGFTNSTYDKLEKGPDGQQRKIGELKANSENIEILFEGVNTDIYKKVENSDTDMNTMLNDIKEDFAFLFVGQWNKGSFGKDRKDIFRTIKVFYEAFANKKEQPALILKTNGASLSILDKEECLKKIDSVKKMFPSDWKLPKVYLLHGDLTKKEMNELYNHPKVKCMVSFTHGEGFGRPLLEFSMVGKPIIASGWSGQMDFLDHNLSVLIPGDMKQVPTSAVWEDIVIPESHWFHISENHAYSSLIDVYKSYNTYLEKSEKMMVINREKFNHNAMTNKLLEILERKIPKQVKVTLPKLKKKKQKIELPKLNNKIGATL